ncbi:MAG: ribulose-phosphate 3-epimerase [Bacteroidetes bacterium]|nr:ribulose-phosphate 3-epimerase [Bacteroidota bacterium]
MNKFVAPSLLSANFACLEKDIEMLNQSQAGWFHIDVMDGVFVPNISFGPPVIKHIKKLAKKPLDVHLMIVDPDRYYQVFKDAGADILTIHYEACTHLNRSISAIKKLGIMAGVVLNPHTNVNLLENIIMDVDLVLLMSVNPGFGGQKFIENTYRKISQLKEMTEKYSPKCLIEVDGGVDVNNAAELYQTGADVLVAGNSVFSSNNPIEAIRSMSYKL